MKLPADVPYLEENIGHEEDDQRIIVLVVVGDLELLREAKDIRVGDIHTIQEGQQIHDAEEGDDMEIDFGDQLALGGVRRTHDHV